jgi:hypothetical protein
MFTLFNKNNIFINSSLRNYIRTSINQSIQKYIKSDDNIKEINIVVLNEIGKINKDITGENDIECYDKSFNKNKLFGFILFLSIPTFIHYLYSKK